MSSHPARRSLRAPAALLALALAVAGCSGDDDTGRTAPEPAPTPIADLNTAALQVPRIEFCGLVPEEAAAAVLAEESAPEPTDYGNGDTAAASGVADQVLHELGCVWEGESGTSARAWVFARPVDAAFAQQVVAGAGRRKGCTVVAGPAFGAPAYTQQCTEASGAVRARHAGLFGQTWLTCEATGLPGTPAPEVVERLDPWCVEVVGALNTAR